MEMLGRLFQRKDDPYAGVDWDAARSLGAVLWTLGTAVSLVLWTLSPPDEAIGDAGWVVAAVLVLTGSALAVAYRSPRIEWTGGRLLATGYVALAGIAVMQWLAGGTGAPYERLLLLPVVYVAVLHPPRQIAAFMGCVALILAAPLFYDGWNSDAAATAFASFVLWSVMAVAAHLLMSGVRTQRLRLRQGEMEALALARLDELTGIGNRRAFEEAMALEIERARRSGEPLAVLMADIETFKSVNDEFGHLEGDRCLREVAEAISAELRMPDRCFRWGGDEFAVLLPGTDLAGTGPLVERLRNYIAVRCSRPNGERMHVRFGAAELEPGGDAAELVERADLALTEAKAGRR
jgi:diguanylate cyclase (GGDEF)-like protein